VTNPYFNFTGDFIAGTRVQSQAFDTLFAAIAAGFDNLPAPATALKQGTATLATESGSGNAFVVSFSGSSVRTSNQEGDEVVFRATHGNTGPATLQVDSITPAVPLVGASGVALESGDIVSGFLYVARYDNANTRFVLINPQTSYITQLQTIRGYAEEWANKAEDSLISTAAGGDGSTEYSALHWAAKAAGFATDAESEAGAAAALYDLFDDRYLGAKSADPTVDNDGDPLAAGALYFNTTSGVMRVYSGSAWGPGYTLTPKFTNVVAGSTSVNPDGTLHVHTGSAGTIAADTNSDDLVVENSGNVGLSFLSPAGSTAAITFGDPDDNVTGQIRYDHSTDQFSLFTAGAARAYLDATGLGVGVAPAVRLHVAQTLADNLARLTFTEQWDSAVAADVLEIVGTGGVASSAAGGYFGVRFRDDVNSDKGVGIYAVAQSNFANDVGLSLWVYDSALSPGYREAARLQADGSLKLNNGVAPVASPANAVQLYAQDVSGSSELRVRDEAGNVTTLSPHNFSLVPGGASEELAWSYYSERAGRAVNVDMLRVVRLVEALSGETLVYQS
jgi:hypothetical protein